MIQNTEYNNSTELYEISTMDRVHHSSNEDALSLVLVKISVLLQLEGISSNHSYHVNTIFCPIQNQLCGCLRWLARTPVTVVR